MIFWIIIYGIHAILYFSKINSMHLSSIINISQFSTLHCTIYTKFFEGFGRFFWFSFIRMCTYMVWILAFLFLVYKSRSCFIDKFLVCDSQNNFSYNFTICSFIKRFVFFLHFLSSWNSCTLPVYEHEAYSQRTRTPTILTSNRYLCEQCGEGMLQYKSCEITL